jgi:hypothetical protein
LSTDSAILAAFFCVAAIRFAAVKCRPQVFRGRPGQAGESLRVVAGAFGGVGQHAVGFGDLLEPLLRVRLGACIGVIAAG